MRLDEVDSTLIELPPKVLAAFEKLGDDQRGIPERLMVRAQHLMGGGVMSFCIEHTGDLSHRMTHMLGWGTPGADGREYIVNKCEKVLRTLQSGYGFEKEFHENIKNNAESMGKEPKEFFEEVARALNKYARAHSQLTVYNHAQWLARGAAVMLGFLKPTSAEMMLENLLKLAKNEQMFAVAAREYQLDDNGNPIPYKQ